MNPKKLVIILLGISTASTALAQCPPNTNGLLQGATTVCAAGNSGTITIGNPGFTAAEWYYSTNNVDWTVASGSSSSALPYSNLTRTTYYQAKVSYSTCTPVLSNVVAVTVDPVSNTGSISGATKGCRYTHSGTLALQGYTGGVQDWLVYDTITKVWNATGHTGSQYNFTNLATETQYKAVVKNGVCPAATSTAATVGVFLLPEVAFNDPSGCLGTAMQFNEAVTKPYEADNTLIGYNWNFDDGTSSTQRFPQKTYTNARLYQVTLTATTNNNCRSALTKPINVYHNPVADFQVANVCAGDSTHFINTSTSASGALTAYNWTFGDMESATVSAPAHKYAAAQTYTVGLSVVSEYGCSRYTARTTQVYHNPVAAFVADSVCRSNATGFTNLSTTNDGVVSKFNWTFGDNATSGLQHPSHRYNTAGSYQTKLVVDTDKGCRDSITHEIIVHPLPVTNFTITNACDGTPVQLTNLSTIDKGAIVAYYWNFGDGDNSPDENPEKTYFNPATYYVELQTTSDKGCASRLTKQAVVYKNPVADFSVTNACLHTPVAIQNSSFINNAENLIYRWQLGDGATANNRELQYTYAQAGTYLVKLTVLSDAGHCADSVFKTAETYALPPINAGADVTGNLGYPVQLLATGGTSYRWSPAIGLSATHIANPLATPKETTEYTVEGTDENGCVNYDRVTVTINNDYQVIPTTLITPDGNGQNDTWVITNIENYPQALVSIFDLHGKEIFSSRNYQNTWDGRNKNGDVIPDGTYYYFIAFTDNNRLYKGAITVLRNK